eukprot:4486682-Amphidinium_carterae.1
MGHHARRVCAGCRRCFGWDSRSLATARLAPPWFCPQDVDSLQLMPGPYQLEVVLGVSYPKRLLLLSASCPSRPKVTGTGASIQQPDRDI